MCPEYYQLREKLAEVCRRERTSDVDLQALDEMPLKEVTMKMDIHIQNCEKCQENMAWMRGEGNG